MAGVFLYLLVICERSNEDIINHQRKIPKKGENKLTKVTLCTYVKGSGCPSIKKVTKLRILSIQGGVGLSPIP